MAEIMSDNRYWCPTCALIVNAIMEIEIKCPFCNSDLIIEMNSVGDVRGLEGITEAEDDEHVSDQFISSLAPIIREMMGGWFRRRRSRFPGTGVDSDTAEEHDLEVLFQRRKRAEAVLQLLQGICVKSGWKSETKDRERERERGSSVWSQHGRNSSSNACSSSTSGINSHEDEN